MHKYGKAAATLILIGAGGFLVFRGIHEYLESQQSQQQIADTWQDESALPDMPQKLQPKNVPPGSRTPLMVPRGKPFSHLEIPRLHTSLYVVEGSDAQSLKKGPGHVRGSAMPGERGNCVIAGHRDLHFRALKDIQLGDRVYVQDAQGKFCYRVTGTKIISPKQIEVLQPTKDSELHLITCYPFYFLGHAPQRFVVTAQLESADQSQAVSVPLTAPHTSPARQIAAAQKHRSPAPRSLGESERERALEATRALNRAAAGAGE